jgi:hypothetical protein
MQTYAPCLTLATSITRFLPFIFLRVLGRSIETLKSVKIDQNRPEPSKSLTSLSPQRDAEKFPERVQ